jgi:hypothetical protein
MGLNDKARQAYLRAKDLDVCPLRILEPMNESIHTVCQRTGTALIGVRQAFDLYSRHGIPGGYLLVDHVHPSIPGHQLIAELLVDELVAQRLAKPRTAGWQAQRDAAYKRHALSLDDWYYLEGERRLRNLRAWAEGLSTLPPPDDLPATDQSNSGAEQRP